MGVASGRPASMVSYRTVCCEKRGRVDVGRAAVVEGEIGRGPGDVDARADGRWVGWLLVEERSPELQVWAAYAFLLSSASGSG